MQLSTTHPASIKRPTLHKNTNHECIIPDPPPHPSWWRSSLAKFIRSSRKKGKQPSNSKSSKNPPPNQNKIKIRLLQEEGAETYDRAKLHVSQDRKRRRAHPGCRSWLYLSAWKTLASCSKLVQFTTTGTNGTTFKVVVTPSSSYSQSQQQ
jgi:hypothetical protein